jgi:tetratricopeptide (TPR) repeat protein
MVNVLYWEFIPKDWIARFATGSLMRIEMTKRSHFARTYAAAIIGAILFNCIPATAQDLVPVSDITGGSSVFVFRNTARSTKKFSSSARSTRTKAQRLETAKKIRKQYDATAGNQRVKSSVVTPDKVPVSVKTLSKEKASALFAGVGEYYIAKNDLDNSIDFFRESITLNDKNKRASDGLSDALAAKAHELLISEKADTARAYFLEALKNNPKNAAAYFGLGEIYTDLNQTDEAVASYEKALANDPSLTEIFMPLGILYYQKGEIAKADELLTKAVANSSETAETQVFLGVIRFSQNRNDEALAAFQRAKAIDPDYAEAYLHTGDVLMRTGKTAGAVAEYQKAVSLRSTYFEAWRGIGTANFELKNYPDAIAAFTQAKKLKNDNPDVYAALGDAYRLAGSYNDAESSYALARDFMLRNKDYSPDEIADVYSKIGFVVGRQCEQNMKNAIACRWPAAIKALEKAVELGGGNTADFSNLGWAYYNAARIDFLEKRDADGKDKLLQAKMNLEKAVAANPTYVQGPLLNLGMTLTDLGDFAGAADALEKVVRREPDWVFAINELGIAYRKQNNFKDAITQFKKAINKDDSFAAAHYNLGESEFRNGNLANAKKEFQKLKKLGREDLAAELLINSNGAVGR